MSADDNGIQPLENDPAFGLICDAVAQGEIVLFLGAGVHVAPKAKLGLPWKYDEATADRSLTSGAFASTKEDAEAFVKTAIKIPVG